MVLVELVGVHGTLVDASLSIQFLDPAMLATVLAIMVQTLVLLVDLVGSV
jgi:hypothetical protein